jgi:glycosyltransferase involved in cell wall biosynthesis
VATEIGSGAEVPARLEAGIGPIVIGDRRTSTGTSTVHRPIAFDLVRVVLGAANGSPRGIDRICFGFMSHLFETWPAECVGVLPTPWGVRFFSRERVLRLRDRLARIWREHDVVGEDPALVRLRAACTRPTMTEPPRPRRRPMTAELAEIGRAATLLAAAGVTPGRAIAALPHRTLFLDVAHRGLMRPSALGWLDRRPDVSPVFMIHDVIPLQSPELVSADERARHATMLDVAARRAAAILTTTATAADGIAAELARRGRTDLPIHPVGLPIDDLFRSRPDPDPVIAARPYFLVCGAIDPRKNHAVLVEAWTRLVAIHGDAAPRLVVAGAAGGATAGIVKGMVAERGLAGHVVFASGLSSPSIARLMAGARAVLLPSLAEGYGLPPAEAMAMGTPAVVSDIPALHDAAGEAAIHVGTGDVEGWTRTIDALTRDTPARADALRRARRFRAVDWTSYMATIGDILARVE